MREAEGRAFTAVNSNGFILDSIDKRRAVLTPSSRSPINLRMSNMN